MVSCSARKCSSGLRLAFLASAAFHLYLLASMAFLAEAEIGDGGKAQKKLQMLLVRRAPDTGAAMEPPIADPRVSRRNEFSQVDAVPARIVPETPFPSPVTTETPTVSSTAKVESVDPLPTQVETVSAGVDSTVRAPPLAELPSARNRADAIRSYRIALASTARRFKLYPPMARERGIGGRSEVLVFLVPAGRVEVRLHASSGESSLDQAALEMVRRAVGGVELPHALRNQRMELMLPVEFVPEG